MPDEARWPKPNKEIEMLIQTYADALAAIGTRAADIEVPNGTVAYVRKTNVEELQ